MPALVVVYLGVLAVISGLSLRVHIRNRTSPIALAARLGGDLILVVLFVAYFHTPIGDALGRSALPLFALGFTAFALTKHRYIARIKDDTTVTPTANFATALGAIALVVLAYAPLIAYGGLAAFRAWSTAT